MAVEESAGDLGLTMSAAALSGLVVRLVLHPIDTAKARLQVQTTSFGADRRHLFRNLPDVLVRTLKEEGVRGLYR